MLKTYVMKSVRKKYDRAVEKVILPTEYCSAIVMTGVKTIIGFMIAIPKINTKIEKDTNDHKFITSFS
jgi:hypothetical protein